MARFAILLHGRPVLLLDKDGNLSPGGVYSWRVVETSDPNTAIEHASLDLLSDELLREEMWNQPDDPPQVTVEEFSEMEDEACRDDFESQCVFYYDDEDALPFGA